MDILPILILLTNITILFGLQAKKGKDPNACVPGPPQQDPSQDPPYPELPTIYSTRVECNIVDKNYTTDVHEYYNQTVDAGAMHQLEHDQEVWGIYDYLAGELLIITSLKSGEVSIPGSDSCSVVDLNQDPERHLFNYTVGKNSKLVFSAYGAFRRGSFMTEYKDTAPLYLGQSTLRGMQVNGWRLCVWWEDIDATLNIDWYFTVPKWNVSSGDISIPVRAHVYGLIYETPTTPRHIEHFYEFADFRHSFHSERDFEVPKGTYCPGRKNMKPLPSPPTFFSFEQELILPSKKEIGWAKEFYDYKNNLFRHDYLLTANKFGMSVGDKIIEVHDFSTGVAYVMDQTHATCRVQLIDPGGVDVKLIDAFNHVVIRTAKEFFDFDKGHFAYEGVRNTRGIDCDVWVANRQDWPSPDQHMDSTWEWYFATKSWMDNAGETYTYRQPVKLDVYAKEATIHFTVTLYNFESEKPDFWSFNLEDDFNIELCYNYSTRHDFQFQIPGKFRSLVLQDRYTFKKGVMDSLRLFLNSSPLRFKHLQRTKYWPTNFEYSSQRLEQTKVMELFLIDLIQENILISFTLLDKAPIRGNVITPIPESPLEFLSKRFTWGVNNGKVILRIPNKKTNKTVSIKAIPHSVSHKTVQIVNESNNTKTAGLRAKQNPYTSGDLAAVGVVIPLGCFFISGAIVFVLLKRRQTGSWLSFAPKTFTNEKSEEHEGPIPLKD